MTLFNDSHFLQVVFRNFSSMLLFFENLKCKAICPHLFHEFR